MIHIFISQKNRLAARSCICAVANRKSQLFGLQLTSASVGVSANVFQISPAKGGGCSPGERWHSPCRVISTPQLLASLSRTKFKQPV